MAKTKTVDNKELEEFLAKEQARKAANTSTQQSMTQLAINDSSVDKDGNDIKPHTFNIRGGDVYSRTAVIRPLRYYSKFIKQVQTNGQWKIDNESIFVENPFTQNAYDLRGGIACGRLVGKTPANWTETQKLDNLKKAVWYGFLFGIVTLPGAEPVLVNFRIPQSKTRAFGDALKLIGKEDMYKYNFNFTLKLEAGKKFPIMEVAPDLAHKLDQVSDIIEDMKEVDSFVEASNARIMKQRERLQTQVQDQQDYKDIKELASDFDDEIPFGGKE